MYCGCVAHLVIVSCALHVHLNCRETATSTGDDNSGLIEKTEIVSSIELAGRLALLRNRIHSLPGCSPVEFLGPIETAASVQALHLAKRGVMRPYSWVCASVLVDFLQTAQAGISHRAI